MREGVDAEHAGEDARDRAQHHQPRTVHAEHVAPALARVADERHGDAGDERREEADLEDGEPPAERLDAGVAAGKDREGEKAEQDALDHAKGTGECPRPLLSRRLPGRVAKNRVPPADSLPAATDAS